MKYNVDHPYVSGDWKGHDGSLIVFFTVPHVSPSLDAQRYAIGARALIAQFSEALKRIEGEEEFRRFEGHITMPHLTGVVRLPASKQFSDDEIAGMRTAVEAAYQGCTVCSEWHNQTHGWPGYSIQIKVAA